MSLQWYRADAYHQRSSCGRFSVARVAVDVTLWYEAYRWPGQLLGATRVAVTAPIDEMKAAAQAMRDLCEAEAGVQSPPTTTETPHDVAEDPGPG